jgi:hypothetical protein
MEDGGIDVDHLRARLPTAEVEAVVLLTRDPDGPYQGYIDRLVAADGLAGNLARAVKQADLLDNLRRCAVARDPAVGQYGRALAKLWSADDTV